MRACAGIVAAECANSMYFSSVTLHSDMTAHRQTERMAFSRLLEMQDPQLLAYVMRREQPEDPELANVVARLTDPADLTCVRVAWKGVSQSSEYCWPWQFQRWSRATLALRQP